MCLSHGHWVCSGCTENGLCKQHKSRCQNTHALWFNIVSKFNIVKSACNNGCIALTTAHCVRTQHALHQCPRRDAYSILISGRRLLGYTAVRTYALQNRGTCTADGMIVVPGKTPFKAFVLASVPHAQHIKLWLPYTESIELSLTVRANNTCGIHALHCSAETPTNVVQHAVKLWSMLHFSAQ